MSQCQSCGGDRGNGKLHHCQQELNHPPALAYCKKCNAPHAPVMAVLMRCGPCTIKNGALPPTKYKENKK